MALFNFNFFSSNQKSNLTIFDKLVMALNKRVDEKNSEVVLLLETYISGDNNIKPRISSRSVNLTVYELDEFSKMNQIERVATLFLLLDNQKVSNLFSQLTYDMVIEISNAINQIQHIKKRVATAILEEFYIMTHHTKLLKLKGDKFLKDILEKTFDKDEIKEILAKIGLKIKKRENLKYLTNFDSQRLAKFLSTEHPQVIALILSHLPDSKSAKILSHLAYPIRVDILIRIANTKTISSEILTEIFNLLEDRLMKFEAKSLNIDGENRVTKILSFLKQRDSKELIKSIKRVDFNLATTLNSNIFCFEDIIKLTQNEILELLKVIDRRELAIALKGSSDEIKQRFLTSMEKKSQNNFYDEMLFLGAIKVKNINNAKTQIVKKIYNLYELGIIQIAKS